MVAALRTIRRIDTNRFVVSISISISISMLVVLAATVSSVQTASAQERWHELRVASVEIKEISQTSVEVGYEAAVEIVNNGAADFDSVQRVDYQIDDGPIELAYVITGVDAGENVRFTFQFHLTPGMHDFRIIIGEFVYETLVDVGAADLTLEIAGDRVIQGGLVELDIEVVNRGNRIASDIKLVGTWRDETTGEVGEATTIPGLDILLSGSRAKTRATFRVNPGSIKFSLVVSAASVDADPKNNELEVVYDVEFVELIIQFKSAESIRWVSEKSALMQITVEVSNIGIDVADSFAVGFHCRFGDCLASEPAGPIAPGETIEAAFQVWMPIGKINGNLYAGGNDDGFRWGHLNVAPTSLSVPDSPPLEWSLVNVSEVQAIQYWSDGSANVVIQTTLENNGSDLVSGELPISVQCLQDDIVIKDCGGMYSLQVDPTDDSNSFRQPIKVPQGETELYFSQVEDDPIAVTAVVPERIVGVAREAWECFSDTLNLGKEVPDDWGVGCAAWGNEYVVKWPNDAPIKVWMSGEDAYQAIFVRLLEDLESVLNLEFQTVSTQSAADISAFLGLPRVGTVLERLGCNHAAGCATFDVRDDGTIVGGHLAVWPPTTSLDQVGIDHMIYSVALHELLHVLTGMLHRHQDETSVMSYSALDYLTLSESDLELIRIALHPLVEPKMMFHEIRELIVFNDELVDAPDSSSLTPRDVLRRAHANLMDAGSARYEISGGWPSCEFRFEQSEYTIGNFNPRSPKWLRFTNDEVDFYTTRSPTSERGLHFWVEILGRWQQVPNWVIQNQTSFRDSFSNPLGLLSSINIYADDADLAMVSDGNGQLTLRASHYGADIVVEWSNETLVDVEMQINAEDFTIESYKINWTFDPVDDSFCTEYQIDAELADYGSEFVLPEDILANLLP